MIIATPAKAATNAQYCMGRKNRLCRLKYPRRADSASYFSC
jgi:hypothetical protein